MENDIYNNDIAAYMENLECIEKVHFPYVVIAPSYMVYAMDYSQLLQEHIDSGADITLLYHSVDNAKEAFLNCSFLNLNRQKGVLSIETNRGSAKNRNIFMDTYVMKKELFLELIHKAHKTLFHVYAGGYCQARNVKNWISAAFPTEDIFAPITDFKQLL